MTSEEPTTSVPPAEPALTAAHSPLKTRLVALLIVLAGGAVLAAAIWLRPDPHGYGTHTQLPFQGPCGFMLVTGYPCPTCGMTTAFAYTVRGRLWHAFQAQPAGLILAIATIFVVCRAAIVVVTGRPPRFCWYWLTPFHLFTGLLVLLLGSWAYVLIAGLITGKYPLKQ
ncbi:MAG: DUF2752 domain-containing protein [Phycisphaerae bacterium]|nr:DUF2752 domain-containing protein [Phycisphaerae bacterium]